MTLKQFIETHPLPTLIAVAAATTAATASVVTTTLGTKYESDRARLETEYKSDLSSLKTRLASIERKLGADDKTYFDVSQLVVTSDKVKTLDQSYKSGGDGLFFYAQPAGELWRYELTSEAGLAALKLSAGDLDETATKLLAALGQKNLHLWRKDQVLTLMPKARKGFDSAAPNELKFFPMVAVQVISEAQLRQAIGGMKEFFDDQSSLKKLSDTLDRLLVDLKSERPSASANAPEKTSQLASAAASQSASTPVVPPGGDKQLELEELLGNLFRGDMAAVALIGLIGQTLQLPQLFEGAEGALSSVQKKGNVLYVQSTLRFRDTTVAGIDKPVTLTVDREIFIVTNTKNMYIVQVEVPSLDGRSDAYAWVGQWLSSVRIPL